MKRAPFLGATGAVLLAGCGGHHVMGALPGVAPSSTSSSKRNTVHGRLVPEVADPIPANVLNNPIIGEARRFDGTVAPAGWMFAQGQPLPVTGNHPLFSVLGTSAGGDGKTTFTLPNPGFGTIVAVGGSSITSPQMLAQSGRHMTVQDSLGPGAIRSPLAMPKPPSPQLTASRQLMTSAIRVGRPFAVPLSREMRARITQAHVDARAAAVAQLSPTNQRRLEAAVQAAVDGRISVYGAVTEMQSSLTNAEADALLHVDAAMIRQFNDRWDGNPRPNLLVDAANFLISVVITREQVRTIFLRERSLER